MSLQVQDTRIEHMAMMAYASCGMGGHFRIVTSMPYVTWLFKIQHLAALQFTQVTLKVH